MYMHVNFDLAYQMTKRTGHLILLNYFRLEDYLKYQTLNLNIN